MPFLQQVRVFQQKHLHGTVDKASPIVASQEVAVTGSTLGRIGDSQRAASNGVA
jgi:hypothetical protein